MSDKLVPYRGPVLEGVVETQVDCRCERPIKLWPGERCSSCGAIAIPYKTEKSGNWCGPASGEEILADIQEMIRVLGESPPRHRCVFVTLPDDEEAFSQSRRARDDAERNWSGQKLRNPRGVFSTDKS